MILRLSSDQLRRMADQLDALTAMEAAGADHLPPNTQIRVDRAALAYAHWWQDEERYLAEFIDFAPGNASPLIYHQEPPYQIPDSRRRT